MLDRLRVKERSLRRGNNDELDDGGRSEEEVGGRNDDVLGLGRIRTHEKDIAQNPRSRPGANQYSEAPIDFSVPVTRGVRPMTEDGRTSFHFKHATISKTAKERVSKKGAANRPGAPRAHSKYIERPGAVAIIDSAKLLEDMNDVADAMPVSGQPPDLERLAEHPFYPPLERKLDHEEESRRRAMLRRVAGVRAAMDEQFAPNAGQQEHASLAAVSHISAMPMLGNLRYGSIPARHVGYVERPDALAILDDGTPAVFTNISSDAREREEFWDKVEALARKPGPDVVKFTAACSPAFLASLISGPNCPRDLAAALLKAVSGPPLNIPVADLAEVEKFVVDHPEYDPNQPQAKFAPARGGRTQSRIVGELPHDLSLQQCAKIVMEFAVEFAKRGLPYVAVIHAPDHNNDDRNWHFHLDYYEHPAARMADGQWDFEVAVTTVDKHYNRRTRYPYRQKVCADVRSKQWIPRLRKRLADITNAYLSKAGIGRRLDPRTYEELGIPRKPQKKLGTKASALEAMGHATKLGAENAEKEWDELLLSAENEAERRKTEAIAAAHQRKAEVRSAIRALPQLQDALTLIDRWRDIELAAQDLRFLAEDTQIRTDRALSRARKTAATCQKKIDAIDAGHVKSGEAKKLPKLIKGRDQANAYIEDMREVTDEAHDLIRDFRTEAAQLQANRDRDLRDLDALVAKARDANSAVDRKFEVPHSAGAVSSPSTGTTIAGLPGAEGRAEGIPKSEPSVSFAKMPRPAARIAEDIKLPTPDFDAMFKELDQRPGQISIRDDRLVPDRAILDALGITLAQVTSEPMQRRLQGFARKDDRERRRLESYARSRPFGLVPSQGGLTFDEKTPLELRLIHERWKKNAQYQSRLREILDAAQQLVMTVVTRTQPGQDLAPVGGVTFPPGLVSTPTDPLASSLVEQPVATQQHKAAMAASLPNAPGAPHTAAAKPGVNRLSPEQVQRATEFGPNRSRVGPAAIATGVADTAGSTGDVEIAATRSDKPVIDERHRLQRARLLAEQQRGRDR